MRKALFAALVLALVAAYMVPVASQATTVQSGSLIKGESFSTVYYFGADGKRYVFPNSKTYFTWFDDFSMVITITDSQLGAIMIGGNVAYKPNKRLVKITTDPKVYWVGDAGRLHHVTTESIAIALFGSVWNTIIDDVPDAFFVNYSIGDPIETESLPSYTATTTINKNKDLSDEPDPVSAGDGSLSLTASANGSTVDLSWTMSAMDSPKGFKVVKNTTGSPVYPGDAYHYKSDPDTRSDSWTGLSDGTYYFRVCEYLGGSCGVYSNEVTVTVEGGTATAGDGEIALSASASGSTVNLSWETGMDTPKGFKVVKNTTGGPVYPGDSYVYKSSPSTRSYSWSGLSAGTYYFRVCEYLGGSCGVYSNQVEVTVEGGTTTDGEIALSASTSASTVNLSWDVTGIDTSAGFKIVKNATGSPVYPGDSYVYKSSPSTRSYSWNGVSEGTWYFRVCEYVGGECNTYSNQVEVTVEGTSASTGTIELSGTVDSDTVNLSWTMTGMTSDGGFKIVKNTTGNPVYPGDSYHYEGDPDARTDTWKYMDPDTYYFRVCEYLGGGECGVYSNQVTMTVE